MRSFISVFKRNVTNAADSTKFRTANFPTALIAFFLFSLPLAGFFWDCDTCRPLVENRKLAPFPAARFEFSSPDKIPSEWNSYLTDHFPFRNCLIYWGKLFRFFVLQVSTNDSVILGRDHWLYFNIDGGVESFKNRLPYTEKDLSKWLDFISEVKKRLVPTGAKFYILIAPNSQTLYPEHLPRSIVKERPGSRLDTLKYYLLQHGFEIIDPRDTLLEAKKRQKVYQPTDTHWTEWGAFYTYQLLFQRIAKDFPAQKPKEARDFTISNSTTSGGDLSRLLGVSHILNRPVVKFTPKVQKEMTMQYSDSSNADGKSLCPTCGRLRAVLIGDSFAGALLPFIRSHFNYVRVLMSFYVDWKVIQAEQPDIFIYEIVERRLDSHPPPHFLE